MRRRTTPRFIALILSLLCAAAFAAACTSGGDGLPPEQKVAQAYLDALGRGDAAAAAAQTSDPAAAQPAIAGFYSALQQGDDQAKIESKLAVTKLSGRTDTAATAEASFSWSIPGGTQPWVYSNGLPLVKAAATPGSS